MKITTVSALLAVLFVSACATGIPREEGETALDRYKPYLGEPVSQFNMYSRYDGWTDVDRDHLLIHTNVNESYLLRVDSACTELQFATRVGIQSRFRNTVSSGFDSIRVGRERCRILEIRPVNYKQMKADLAAEKNAQKRLKG